MEKIIQTPTLDFGASSSSTACSEFMWSNRSSKTTKTKKKWQIKNKQPKSRHKWFKRSSTKATQIRQMIFVIDRDMKLTISFDRRSETPCRDWINWAQASSSAHHLCSLSLLPSTLTPVKNISAFMLNLLICPEWYRAPIAFVLNTIS